MLNTAPPKKIAIIGGGPAGLMAAQTAAELGAEVHVFERKASVGRKFLIAGRGGLNLSHSENFDAFVQRFGVQQNTVSAWLKELDNNAIREWANDLGIDTFVGSSGRVFPSDMKAAPLLRAWQKRLRELDVRFHVNHYCMGFSDNNSLRMATPNGEQIINADAIIFALGGGSWPQLGSDGAWQTWLSEKNVSITTLQAANCGFNVAWSDLFKNKFAGQALKPLRISLSAAQRQGLQGECVISEYGIEGSLIYALSADIREQINQAGTCTIYLDVLPDHSYERISTALNRPRNARSLSDVLRRMFSLSAVKTALLYEVADKLRLPDSSYIAQLLKHLPITLTSARPISEAISTAGGVALPQLDQQLMLKNQPGLFFAGEMLDWEAPTGGYLLSACLASGRLAGLGAVRYLA